MANTNEWWKSGATPVEQPPTKQDHGWWKAGAKEVVPETPSRSVLAAVNDTVIETANAFASGVGAAANFVKPGNAVSGFIDKHIIKPGEEKQSDAVKAEKKRYADEMAGADGIGDEAGATLGYAARNPLLAAGQVAGSIAGPGAAIKGLGTVAKVAGAGAKAITNAGRVGGVVASGAMAGGDAAGTAYDLATKAGATEEQAVAAGRQASAIPAVVGAVSGAFGAEKLLAGAKGFGGSTAARAIKTGASEALQEGIEEGVTQYEGQRAAMPYDPSIDPTKGVAGAATMGAVLGGATGGGVSLLAPAHGARPEISEGMRVGAAAFADGVPRTPPDSIKSVIAKAQWVRGWDAAATAQGSAGDAAGAAADPAAQPWTTSPGAAADVEPGTAPASPANAPNLDYETLPGAAPEAVGKEIPFEREFDTGGLSLQSTQPASAAPVLDHDVLRDKAGVMMPPQLDSGRIEVETGLQPLSNEQQPRQWNTGNLSLVGEGQPQAPLSQRMGLDPKAGALSKAAAMAVDSGASPVLQPQAAPQVPAGVDPDTGEVSLQAQMDELKSRIAFMNQQGATQGWDGNRAAQRNALQTQLTRLELQAAGGQGRGASTAGAPAPVQLTGINQILAKQVPDMSEQELQQAIAHYGPNHKRTKKLEKALQALAQKPLTAIESGANGNVSQADQTQQGGAQPAQAGAAQAGQDAGQGVGNGTAPTADPGAQEQGASVAKAQPFALAEQFNRRSTFIASYRIAKDQGMADPAAFARKAVQETQFVYSKANKPKWARGAVGGTLFTFKTYSVSYLELMQRMWNQGGPEGKRAVGWALAMLLLMSGAGGVPFMEDAEDLIDGAGQMMGYNISAKQWRKELLANVVGKELAEFMEQGISGLPGAPIDVSGRLGMGMVWGYRTGYVAGDNFTSLPLQFVGGACASSLSIIPSAGWQTPLGWYASTSTFVFNMPLANATNSYVLFAVGRWK